MTKLSSATDQKATARLRLPLRVLAGILNEEPVREWGVSDLIPAFHKKVDQNLWQALTALPIGPPEALRTSSLMSVN